MQNSPRSHGLWEASAPAAPKTSPLEQDIVIEAAVIGAGYTGLSTALHLMEHGIGTAVLEEFDIGFGGAGRNVGLVNAGLWVMPDELIAGLGEDYGRRLLGLLGDGPEQVWKIIKRYAISCEASHAGTLHAGVGRKGFAELAERFRQWSKHGAPVELLGKAEAATALGSSFYEGALMDRRAGTIQPLAYARGLAAAAQKLGAQIFTGSPATELERDRDTWRIRTPHGSVRARRVVFATDAYTRHMQEDIARQQILLPYFNVATPPLDKDVARQILPGRQGVWDTKDVLLSFRFDATDRLIFGSVGALRNTGTGIHRAWARRALNRIFPQIGDIRFEYEWYGQIGMTSDNLPRFHKLDENIFAFCGYNGRGIAPGTVFGQTLAALLAGEITESELPLPVTTPSPIAARSLRSAFYEAGAQIVHLAEARL